MKKVIIDQLVEEMIQILITEIKGNDKGTCLVVKHYVNDALLGGLIKKSKCRYGLDWDADIIRDQAYASMYESMLKVSQDLDGGDINLDNEEFRSKSLHLSRILMDESLISRAGRDKEGNKIYEFEEPIDPQADEETGKSRLEELLNKQCTGEDGAENHFLRWFHSNKAKILTKKQLAFINNELVDMDRKNVSKIKQRIADRVITAYNNTYNTLTDRQANLLDNKHIIESILDSKNFREEYIKYRDNEYIVDTMINNVSFDTMKKFNTGSNDKQVIREYRVALFKGLAKVNDKLQEEGVLDLF